MSPFRMMEVISTLFLTGFCSFVYWEFVTPPFPFRILLCTPVIAILTYGHCLIQSILSKVKCWLGLTPN